MNRTLRDEDFDLSALPEPTIEEAESNRVLLDFEDLLQKEVAPIARVPVVPVFADPASPVKPLAGPVGEFADLLYREVSGEARPAYAISPTARRQAQGVPGTTVYERAHGIEPPPATTATERIGDVALQGILGPGTAIAEQITGAQQGRPVRMVTAAPEGALESAVGAITGFTGYLPAYTIAAGTGGALAGAGARAAGAGPIVQSVARGAGSFAPLGVLPQQGQPYTPESAAREVVVKSAEGVVFAIPAAAVTALGGAAAISRKAMGRINAEAKGLSAAPGRGYPEFSIDPKKLRELEELAAWTVGSRSPGIQAAAHAATGATAGALTYAETGDPVQAGETALLLAAYPYLKNLWARSGFRPETVRPESRSVGGMPPRQPLALPPSRGQARPTAPEPPRPPAPKGQAATPPIPQPAAPPVPPAAQVVSAPPTPPPPSAPPVPVPGSLDDRIAQARAYLQQNPDARTADIKARFKLGDRPAAQVILEAAAGKAPASPVVEFQELLEKEVAPKPAESPAPDAAPSDSREPWLAEFQQLLGQEVAQKPAVPPAPAVPPPVPAAKPVVSEAQPAETAGAPQEPETPAAPRPLPGPVTPELAASRGALIDRIVDAARRPLPEIRTIYEMKGTDGKWYVHAQFPSGVKSAGERGVAGYAFVGPDGATVGVRAKSEQELRDRWKETETGRSGEFRGELEKMDPEALRRQADYWLEEKPQPAPKEASRAEPKAEQSVRSGPPRKPEQVEPASKSSPPVPPEKGREIGKNAAGLPIYEDANGIRSIVENGVRQTEPVRVVPGKGPTPRPDASRPDWVKPATVTLVTQPLFGGKREETDVPVAPASKGPALSETHGTWKPAGAEGEGSVALTAAGLLNALERHYGGRWPTGTPVAIRAEIKSFRDALKNSGRRTAPQGSNLFAEAKRHATFVRGVVDVPPKKAEISSGGAPSAPQEKPDEPAHRPAAARKPEQEAPVPVRADGPGSLEGVPSQAVSGAEGRRDADTGSVDRPGADQGPDGGRDAEGDAAPRGSGSSPSGVDSPAAGKRPERRRDVKPSHSDFSLPEGFEDRIAEGGQKTKYKKNVAAIRLLKTLETENRPATVDEKETLAQYTGWGHSPQAFEISYQQGQKLKEVLPEDQAKEVRDRLNYDSSEKWEAEREELRDLLTEDEYNAARHSTINAHYTSIPVIRSMWEAIQGFGFRGGRILEPGMGVGHFFGAMPRDLQAASKLSGVELDDVSARIARKLYENADIRAQGYQDSRFPNSFFDLGVSNVPFANITVRDPAYKNQHLTLHNYFFAKTVDKVRPGGVVAFITSRYTMDGTKNIALRQSLAEKTDLLGAIRLPNTAFQKNAHTEVTTDIIFLRKLRAGETPSGEGWVGTVEKTILDKHGHSVEFALNEYYDRHPDMMLGKMAATGTMYAGGEPTLEPVGNTLERLREAVEKLPKDVMTSGGDQELQPAETILAPDSVREGQYVVSDDGAIRVRRGDELRAWESPSKGALARVRGMIGIRESVRSILYDQVQGIDDSDLKAAQAKLKKLYDRFAKSHGPLNDDTNARLFSEDPDAALLLALEKVETVEGQRKQKVVGLSDIFTERTISPVTRIAKAETAADALLASLSEHGRIDFEYMTQLTGKDRTALIMELGDAAFQNPSGGWETHDTYLTGDVKTKLEEAKGAAEADPAFDRNVKALEKVIPKDVPVSEVSVPLGATWVPVDVVGDFMVHLLEVDVPVEFQPATGHWSVGRSGGRGWGRFGVADTQKWGTRDVSATEIVERVLNFKPVVVTTKANDKVYVDQEATAQANAKKDLILQEWADWVKADDARSAKLAEIYNEKMNRHVAFEADGQHLDFPGMSDVWRTGAKRMRPHQKDAVWRILQKGNTLLAHVVGSGKTATMIAAGMEMRRLGLARKPVYAVLKSTIAQWREGFLDMYPGAKLLVATEKDFQKANRRKFFARIATGDWDAVVVSHDWFTMMPLSPERQKAGISELLSELEAAYLEAKAGSNKNLIKNLEKQKDRWEGKLSALTSGKKEGDLLTFEEMGFDALFVDESHQFKSLFYFTQMGGNVGGLGNQDGSQRAFDMFLKTRHLAQMNRGRGVVFATGTPVTNSMAELYSIQRYLQFDTLDKAGLRLFDAWGSTFGEVVDITEMNPHGKGYRVKQRFARFFNLPELVRMFHEVADVKMREDLPYIVVPKTNRRYVEAKATPWHESFADYMAWRAKNLPKGKEAREPGADNILAVMDLGTKAALDWRMIDPRLPFQEGGKLDLLTQDVKRVYDATMKDKGTQIIFSDVGIPKTHEFDIYNAVRDRLVEMGIPKAEVAFIHEWDTEKKKPVLNRKMNAGDIRILIGNTEKAGTGLNIQQRVAALRHIDAVWKPAFVEQREGRGVRYGNMYDEVEIALYVTSKSLDTFKWQMNETKATFITQLLKGDPNLREMDDIDEEAAKYRAAKLLASGDEDAIRKSEVDQELKGLEAAWRGFQSDQRNARSNIERLNQAIVAERKVLGMAEADIEALSVPEKFTAVVGGTTYDKMEDAGEALLANLEVRVEKEKLSESHVKLGIEPRDIIVTRRAAIGHREKLGELYGFDIVAVWNDKNIAGVGVSGKLLYHASLSDSGVGTMRSLAHSATDGPKSEKASRDRHIKDVQADMKASEQIVKGEFKKKADLDRLREEAALLDQRMKAKGEGKDTAAAEEKNAQRWARDPVDARGQFTAERTGDVALKGLRSRIQEKAGVGPGQRAETVRVTTQEGADVQDSSGQAVMEPEEPYGHTVVGTAAFKKWFGRSVVTKDGKPGGEPLVVYHGTNADFDVFEAKAPTDVYVLGGTEIQKADSWDMGDDAAGMPEGYHYGAVSDVLTFGSAEKALEFREAEIERVRRLHDEDGSTYQPSPTSKRHLADIRRMLGKDLTSTTETRPSGSGAWFTPSASYSFVSRQSANHDTGEVTQHGGSVYPVYLSIQNPIHLSSGEIESAGRPWRMDDYKKQGYDGAIFATDTKDLTKSGWSGDAQIVAFRPEQIKSATGNRGTYDPKNPSIVMEAEEPYGVSAKLNPLAPAFYSALRRGLEGMDFKAMAAPSLLSRLKKAPGVKAEELEATKFAEWMAGQSGKVSKADALAFLDENQVRVQVVEKGGNEQEKSAIRKRILDETPAASYPGVSIPEDPDRWTIEKLRDAGVREDLIDEWWDTVMRTSTDTKFNRPDLTLPGFKEGSYREMLLTLPQAVETMSFPDPLTELPDGYEPITDDNQPENRRWGVTPPGQTHAAPWAGRHATREDAIKAALRRVNENRNTEYSNGWRERNEGKSFRSSHFDEPNILAHVRFNEREGAGGERVLFLEEVQSDWHQKGRKIGYGPVKRWVIYKQNPGAEPSLVSYTLTPNDAKILSEELAQDPGGSYKVVEENWPQGVPDAPFKETPEWVGLALKHVLRYASENGFDAVAWANGAQQVERYREALRKQVDRIEWTKQEGGVRLVGSKDGKQTVDTNEKESALSDAIGKAMADRILEDPSPSGVIEGDDITISDTGMAGFYDRLLPNVAKALARKLDKGHPGVGTVVVDTINPPKGSVGTFAWTEQPSLPITAALRDATLFQGQAVFEKEEKYGGVREAEPLRRELESAARSVRSRRREMGGRRLAAGSDAGGVKTLANILPALERGERVDLRGVKVRYAEDVAIVGQMFRSPHLETFHVFAVRRSRIVAHQAVSSRMPGSAVSFLADNPKVGEFYKKWSDGEITRDEYGKHLSSVFRQEAERMQEWLRRTGADGYYLMHNHPSGSPEPSNADMDVTQAFARLVEGFKGHVVIDHDRYAVIGRHHLRPEKSPGWTGTHETHALRALPEGAQRGTLVDDAFEGVPGSLQEPMQRRVLDHKDISAIGQALQVPEAFVALIYRAGGRTNAVQAMPVSLFRNAKEAANYIRGRAREFGSASVYAYITDSDVQTSRAAERMFTSGVLRDAVYGDGERVGSIVGSGVVRRAPNKMLGLDTTRLPRVHVAERDEPYGEPREKRKHAWQDPAREALHQDLEGVKKPPVLGSISEKIDGFLKYATREFPDLEKGAKYAHIRQVLTRLGKQRSIASMKATRKMDEIVRKLDRDQFDLFSRKVLLDDLTAEVELGSPLPNEWTPEAVASEMERIDVKVGKDSAVSSAIEARQEAWKRLKADYVAAMKAIGFNVEERFKKENYFRHQVLEYVRVRGLFGGGKKLQTPKNRGFLRHRSGGGYINTSYLEPEYEVLSQMFYDVEIARAIKVVDEEHNKLADLKSVAKQMNQASIMDYFRELAADFDPGLDGQNLEEAAAKLYRTTLNTLQAIGFDKLSSIEDLPDTEGGMFAEVIDGIYGGAIEDYDELFRYLSWVLKEHPKTEAGHAATIIFKGIHGKRKFVQEKLTSRGVFKTWEDLIPEGYVTWQPDPGNVMFYGYSIPEMIASQFTAEQVQQQLKGLPADAIRRVLIQGQKRKQYVIPEELAVTLNALQKNPEVSPLKEITTKLTRLWKQQILVSPQKFVGYNLRNLTGDADAVIAGDSLIFKETPKAAAEVWRAMFGDGTMTPRLKQWFEMGGFASGLRVLEFGDLHGLDEFKRFGSKHDLSNLDWKDWEAFWKAPAKAVKGVYGATRDITDFREAIFRYAAFRRAYRILEGQGGNLKPGQYWASRREEVNALPKYEEKAWKLSNDLLGAYDEVSRFGVDLADTAMPFWRWNEVNLRRYRRLALNALDDAREMRSLGRGYLKAIGMGAHVTPYAAWTVGRFLLKAMLLTGVIGAFNHLVFGDEEEEIPEDQKSRPHLIYGSGKDEVYWFPRVGAVYDILDWLALEHLPQFTRDYMSGQRSLESIVKEMAVAPANKLVNALGPAKGLISTVLGRTTYPDLLKVTETPSGPAIELKPGRVTDRWLQLARDLGLGEVYQLLADTPQRPGAVLKTVAVTVQEKGASSYYGIREKAYQWRSKQGKGGGMPGDVDEKSKALLNTRLAVHYGDQEAAKRWLSEYALLGGTPKGLRSSFEAMHPVGMLSKDDQKAFVKSLGGGDQRQLVKALQFYAQVLLGDPEKLVTENIEKFTLSESDVRSEAARLEARALFAHDKGRQDEAVRLRERLRAFVEKHGGWGKVESSGYGSSVRSHYRNLREAAK